MDIVALIYLTSLLNVASSLFITVREGVKNIPGGRGVLKMGVGQPLPPKMGAV